MQLSHTHPVTASAFDDRNLLAEAGLIPVLGLAQDCGLDDLADEHLTLPTDKGAHAGRKVTALVAGMVAGADSIDDMALLRHGAMPTVFDHPYAPSTLGSFLRTFSFGHVRQLDAVATRFLCGLAERTPLVDGPEVGGRILVDLDDTIVPVHGHAKQGSGYGYTGVRGLNALIATATTDGRAPVIVGQRLRRGGAGSPRGAARMVTDAVATVRRLHPHTPGGVLVRADSAFYGHKMVSAAIRAGVDVSVTVRMTAKVKAAIAAIDETAWTPIEDTDAVYDEPSGRWISRAEVAEIDFTAFTRLASERTPGRLVVRRIPDLNPQAGDGQSALFDTWRFHAFFTTTDPAMLDTVTADKVHRGHAIIEQVHADLKNSALAHLPSGRFAANSAWLVLAVMAFNLTRAAAITGARLAKATTATIRRTLISVPARIASSARTLTLHLPQRWPWENEWSRLFASTQRRKPQAI
ncbi:DDE family transposase [Rhodococcus wratislaviensis]|uniref:Transposase n=2 Tax=Rhodococcus wratislaviensis TaxID=44752 RepID=A0AB38F7N7_RHOWR|nr:IS1380 family transposase [Rhodococcus wratislaviensis]REE77486.1 DDE family transposase [Rhodococcus wratislaviensis]GAF44180.1 putative transposase [Rhodococcus wratislaviensis NBRC 100605]SPZ35416.1 transposase [Rhodococcus wratislaviensis]